MTDGRSGDEIRLARGRKTFCYRHFPLPILPLFVFGLKQLVQLLRIDDKLRLQVHDLSSFARLVKGSVA